MKFVELADTVTGEKVYQPIFILTGNESITNSALQHEYSWSVNADAVESVNNKASQLFNGTNLFVITIGQSVLNKMQVEGEHLLFEKLALCFFSKNYLMDNACPVILVNESDLTALSEFKQKLDAYLNEQGIAATKTWKVSSKPIQEQMNDLHPPLVLGNSDDIISDKLMEPFFYNPENIGSYILFRGNSLEQSISVEKEFYRTTQNFLSKNKLYQQLVDKYIEAKSAQVAFSKKVTVVTERLENANSFVELAKSKYKDDYDLLYKFYHNEYEILPLWYKRFGHIVKVFIGKRSFRSLFNDAEKKYKD